MKTSLLHKLFGFSWLLLFVALSSCTPGPEEIAMQTATAQTATAAIWTPTPTTTVTPTSTGTPTTAPSSTIPPVATRTVTPDPTPLTTGSRTSFHHDEVDFSLVVPEGWSRSSDSDKVVLYGPTLDGTELILAFSFDQYSPFGTPFEADEEVGIPMFSAYVQDRIAQMTQDIVGLDEDFRKTPEGEFYFRWVMEHNPNGRKMHQAFYIFGSGEWFVTVMYGRPASAGSEYDDQIDAVINTFSFEE